jgi:hypothetical protein
LATRLWLSDAACAVAGTLPATNASVSALAPTWTPGATNSVANTPLLPNKSLVQAVTPGPQQSIAYTTDNVTTAQRQPLLRFISDPLLAQTITWPANVPRSWCISCSNTNTAFSVSIVLAVWRPSTGATVGIMHDQVAGYSGTAATATPAFSGGTFSSAGFTNLTVQDGDVIVLELWRNNTVQGMATSYTNSIFYNGTSATVTTDAAGYFEFPQTLLFAPKYKNLTGRADGTSTAWAAIEPTDTYGKQTYRLAGLEAYWRMNEKAGASVIRDHAPTGSPHPGAIQGTLGFNQSGALIGNTDTSLDFGAPDGWAQVPDFRISGDFSLEAWIRADTWVDFASIFNRRRWEDSQGGIVLEVRGTGGYVYCFLFSSGSWKSIVNPDPLATGQWHYIAWVYDQASTTMWMYVNGAYVAADTTVGVLNDPAVAYVQIGRNLEFGQLFDGRIDELAFYTRELSAQEIQDRYILGTSLPGGVWGTAAGTSTASGTISRRRALLGASAGKATASGTVSIKPVARDMVGLASGVGTSGGQVTRRRALVAASAGVASTTAVLTRRRALTALAAGASTAAGVISRRRTLPTVLSVGGSTASASITRRRALAAAAVGSSSATGLLTRKRTLSAAAMGSSTATAVTTARRALAGAATGSSVANGKATIKPLAVPVYWDGDTFVLDVADLVAWATTDDTFRTNRADLPTVLWPGLKQPFILE